MCEFKNQKCVSMYFFNSLGEYAFHCSSIKRIFIPSTITEILISAFILCNNLRFVQFEENSEVKEILY